jgi:hypothetical protein
VTPEAEAYLEKAREDLLDARKIAGIRLAKVAARSAYYGSVHCRAHREDREDALGREYVPNSRDY